MGLVSAVCRPLTPTTACGWLMASRPAGCLYVSAMFFGFNLFKGPRDQRLSIAVDGRTPSLPPPCSHWDTDTTSTNPSRSSDSSWSVFVIGDWALWSVHVIDWKQVLASSYFLRITAVNVLLTFGLWSWSTVPPVLMTFYW